MRALALAVLALACDGGDTRTLQGPGASSGGTPAPAFPATKAGDILPAGSVSALHRDGQTFVTFPERTDLRGERYGVYRVTNAPGGDVPDKGALLRRLPKGTGRAYTDRTTGSDGRWRQRFLDRWVIDPAKGQLAAGIGLYVATSEAEGKVWYVVTLQPEGEDEVLYGVSEAVAERPAPPRAVRVRSAADGRSHVYVQYMDPRRWNPTFHAPREDNGLLGLPAAEKATLQDWPAYAYTYVVSEPDPKNCGGTVPAKLPVILLLHGWGGGNYDHALIPTEYFCALQLTPTDFGETWYFGFAERHDYRQGSRPAADDTVVNYTEQRLLRMVSDLAHDPKLGRSVDRERVYVWGHSMGGGGALALASRYPQVFAAAYASQPMTDPAHDTRWLPDVAAKWGQPDQRLPVRFDAPEGWAAPLKKYEGTPVHDWQNHAKQLRERVADEMAPFGVSHGRNDSVLAWAVQGRPAYEGFDAGRRTWGGEITDSDHSWAAFTGLPPPLATDRSLWPFQGLKVKRGETTPGFKGSSANGPLPPPDAPAPPAAYNVRLDWSSSWANWHEPPVDEPDRWCMSLRNLGPETARVEVTPRRAQRFKTAAGTRYNVTVTPIGDGPAPPAVRPVSAGADGLLVVPLEVSPAGLRVCLDRG